MFLSINNLFKKITENLMKKNLNKKEVLDLKYDFLKVGDELPDQTFPPISRHTLALYCGSSGDHNPIHVDIDFAKSSGLDDVIAHGMLSAGYLAIMLTNWVPQSAIRSWKNRFVAEKLLKNLKKTEKNFFALNCRLKLKNQRQLFLKS